MAEVHIIGQIIQAKDFPKQNLFCKWYLQIGNNWKLISGKKEGQTQVTSSQLGNVCKWSFPIDIHLATAGLQEILQITGSNMNKVCSILILCVFWKCLSLQTTTTTTRPKTSITSTTKKTDVTTGQTILSTSNTPTTTCKINGSCFVNSSLTANLTTISSPTNSTAENSSISRNSSVAVPTKMSNFEKKHVPSLSSVTDVCVCDLKLSYCDLNCCCDQDCSLEDRLVFDHCEEDFHYYDRRFCQYKKYTYVNNTPQEFQVNQNGLFCIVRNNLPPSYLIQQKHPLKSLQEAEFQKMNKYSWPHHVPEDTIFSNHNYSYGKPLWILRNTTLETLKIMNSFFTNDCLIKEDVKYLIDTKNICSHTEVSEDNYNLNAARYFVNMLIIANPKLFNISLHKKECPKNICLVVEAKICNEYFENCSQVVKNHTNFKPECHHSIIRNTLSCINVVRHVRYDLYHNGTYGIVKANVLLVLKNISFDYVGNIDFSQTVEVKFMWWNHTLNYSSYLSGNPGYLIGMPVLTAELISVNISVNNTNSSLSNSTHYNQQLKLFRNPTDFANNFMVLPSVSVDGVCVLNKHKYTAVEFGFNSYTKCKINDYILNNNLSAKNMCINIQQTIFKYWSLETTNNSLNNKLIGQFGNANVYNIDEWLNVMYRDDLNIIVNTTWGKFDKKMNTLSCGNITTLLTINFYHSRIDFEDVINQEKILGTVFHFDNFKNITFPINFKEKYFYFTVQTGVQVGFFDITTKKIRKLVDPPSLNIKLPHDFFYPFVKINNGGVNPMCLVHFIFFCAIFVLLVK